jgi:soluble lytic murein transglycosylase
MTFFRPVAPAFTLLVLLVAVPISKAQTPAERRVRIQQLLNQRDYQQAAAELRSLHAATPSVFTANSYDYLLGRVAERQGDLATASTSYRSVAERKSILTQYALWHLAQLARVGGDLPRERETLRVVLATAPGGVLQAAANRRLVQSYFESRDYATVITLVKPNADPMRNADSREALAVLGRSYFALDQKDAARVAFTDLVTRMPNPAQPDDFALEAARALDLMDGGTPGRVAQLAEPEHLRRAMICQFNRDFATARLHFGEIAARFPQSSNTPDALFQIGRGYYNERQYDAALPFLRRVVDEFPASTSAPDAINFAAGALSRLKRTDEAIVLYQKTINDYPNAPTPERPYLNLIDALRDAGRDPDALRWCDTTQQKFAGKPAAGQALFARARIRFQSGDWNGALADLTTLKGFADLPNLTLPGGTTPAELTFLQAYALEQLGRFDEAVSTYLSIGDGRAQYYGGRATSRLQALVFNDGARAIVAAKRAQLAKDMDAALTASNFEAARVAAQNQLRFTADAEERRKLLDVLKRSYAALPAYSAVASPTLLIVGRTELLSTPAPPAAAPPDHKQLADELLFLGLDDEGSAELAVSGPAFDKSSKDGAFTLATLYARGDQANNAVRYAEPIWKTVPADYEMELAPRGMVQLLYPTPYVDPLLKEAPPRGIDPRFVLSIARLESRFRPDVKSYAAARGLMQFISATADQIAAEIPRPGFKQEDLYNPSIAVQFGAQYLGNLFRLFPNQPQAVAASYNAGEDNVARWVARARSTDPDRYVCEIAVAQPKDYVFKVLSDYRMYQLLYDDRLNPR